MPHRIRLDLLEPEKAEVFVNARLKGAERDHLDAHVSFEGRKRQARVDVEELRAHRETLRQGKKIQHKDPHPTDTLGIDHDTELEYEFVSPEEQAEVIALKIKQWKDDLHDSPRIAKAKEDPKSPEGKAAAAHLKSLEDRLKALKK